MARAIAGNISREATTPFGNIFADAMRTLIPHHSRAWGVPSLRLPGRRSGVSVRELQLSKPRLVGLAPNNRWRGP